MYSAVQRLSAMLSTGSIILLTLAICYRHFVIDASDPYKCGSIETAGRWIDTGVDPVISGKFVSWQPRGCPLHTYNALEVDSCLQHKRLFFIGDSGIRQIFWATARKLHRQKAEKASSTSPKHGDLVFEHNSVKIDFRWDPFLNVTDWKRKLNRSSFSNVPNNVTKPVAALVGTGLWHAKELGTAYLDGFKQTIDLLSEFLPRNARNAEGIIVPPTIRGQDPDLVLVAPVLQPNQERLDSTRAGKMTPEQVQNMNDYLTTAALRDNFEVLWTYSLMTRWQPTTYEQNGIHVVDNVAERQADVFLNVACNSLSALQRYPFDKTCCVVPPFVNSQQRLIILIAALTAVLALYRSLRTSQSDPSSGRPQMSSRAISATGTLGFALLYCFVADRTALLDRLQKVPNQQTFLGMVFLAFIVGLLTLQRAGGNGSGHASSKNLTPTLGRTFLSREQTDEWKGWMQFVILAYHYTGMSRVLWIYQIVRLLVASYLFMTGYGHTLYFMKTNQFPLRRVAAVLIRLNLLTCLLAYLMRTDYDFYYFPALSSFWFLVVYFTIRIKHQPNAVPRLFVLKVFVSAVIVRIIIHAPGILEFLFGLLARTCKIHLAVDEIRFRLSLDMYVVYVGMLAAGLTLQLTGGLPCSTTCLVTQVKKVPRAMSVLTIATSAVLLPLYFITTQTFKDKYEYNHWHPIISPLPVLAFVVLRNASQGLRSFHSRIFARLGRISLETFVLQYHIWLAADTKALLSLGLFTRNMDGEWTDKLRSACDFICVTGVFIWASRGVSDATTVLTSFIVGGQKTSDTSSLLQHTKEWKQGWNEKWEENAVGLEAAGSPGSSLNLVEPFNEETEVIKPVVSLNVTKRSWLIPRLSAILFLLWLGNQLYS